MWTYRLASGFLSRDGDKTLYKGYSGHPPYVNDPLAVQRQGEGPIPPGGYTIGEPHQTATHGPFVLRLTPDPANQMHGRDGFLIHGDSTTAPGTASHGCVILPRGAREAVWTSGDHNLMVVKA
jgi:hypothetical protein